MAQHPDYIEKWEKRQFPIHFKWTTGGYCTVHTHAQFDHIKKFIHIQLHEIEASEMPQADAPVSVPAPPAPVLTALRLIPAAATVAPDSVQAFECIGLDAQGDPLDVTPTWTLHGPGALTQDGTLLTTDAPGHVIVTAQIGSVVAVASVTVADCAVETALDAEAETVPADTPSKQRSHHKKG